MKSNMVAPESEGHLQRDKDGCPPFPGEAYTITQYNTWLRDFRGYCARKGCLSVLISGESDDSFETLEEKQKANRKANSTLYGDHYVAASMDPCTPAVSEKEAVKDVFPSRL